MRCREIPLGYLENAPFFFGRIFYAIIGNEIATKNAFRKMTFISFESDELFDARVEQYVDGVVDGTFSSRLFIVNSQPLAIQPTLTRKYNYCRLSRFHCVRNA